MTKPLSKLFKRNKCRSWNEIPASFGDHFHDFDGNPIIRGKRIPAELKAAGKLPAILDNSRTVTGDLIPHTSWGSSLANMLTRTSWNSLRFPLIHAHKNVCELCGIRLNSLDVHEIWSFQPPKGRKKKGEHQFGIQKLEGLVAVCSDCHRCFHLGRETAMGTIDQTLTRLRGINNWSAIEIKEYADAVFTRWTNHSEYQWALDLSLIAEQGPLVINQKWSTHPEHPGLLTTSNDFGSDNLTQILNCPWIFEKP